jgi:hypothetical protein
MHLWKFSYWRRVYHSFEYRKDPVPFTSHSRKFISLRKIQTIQERRWNEAHKDLVKIRGNRKKLPDDWEDIPRSDINHRSWKKHRKTQYKK